MHSSRDGTRSQHGGKVHDPARSEQKHTSSASFASTLSNALNISTPTSARKATLTPTAQSMPTRSTHAACSSHQATPTRPDALRTPVRAPDAPRILTLTGHEAFQSPTTPFSPWILPSDVDQLEHASYASASTSAGQCASTSRLPEQDQGWLMSGPSPRKSFNIFASRSKTIAAAPTASLRDVSTGEPATHPTQIYLPGSFSPNSLAIPHQQSVDTSAGPFHAYREQPSSDPRIGIYEVERGSSDVSTSQAVCSPTSAAAWSPTQFSSAYPSGFSDGSFMSAMQEQDTPSMSTHLLPSQHLTEQLSRSLLAQTAEVRHMSASAQPFIFSMPRRVDRSDVPVQAHPIRIRSSMGLSSGHSVGSGAMGHVPASTAPSHGQSSFQLQPAPRIIACSSSAILAKPGRFEKASCQRKTPGDMYSADVGLRHESNHQASDASARDGREIAGLGLQLDTEPAELVALGFANAPYQPLMSVDEMGRWILNSEGQAVGLSEQSSSFTNDSRGGRVTWQGKDTWNTSLGATTEASFTSHSSTSTWDTSLNDMTSPPSASADSQFVPTSASSIGISYSQNRPPSKPNERPSESSDAQSPSVMTPEVAMHDFSEFGQSVSIEQMADERWRTWPRNRDSVLLRERTSNPIMPTSPGLTLQPQADERASFDSLSVSASSTRSRLMAEPYNKNMRSARPSSSDSTSSRSFIGNAAALDTQQSTGTTGPTRPRSHIATGSLRMSSTTRFGSSGGGAGSDGPSAPTERISGTALALRRARGVSQGEPPPSSSSAAMKLTRSSDAIMPPGSSAASSSSAKFRHSVSLQRTALSSDGLSQAVQRPQSLLETSPDRLGSLFAKPQGKVGFNEVSVALDTLRMFLKQKEQGQKVDENSDANNTTTLPSPVERDQGSSPNKSCRSLRRTKGLSPPRGAFSSVDESGTLQTSSSPSNISSPPSDTPGAISAHGRSQSLGGGMIGSSQPTHNQPTNSRQDDRLAVLEDLSERVMKLKAETERQKEQHAAASMPPPPARPASMQHHRSQSNMTRREMHEEYLRKRANGP